MLLKLILIILICGCIFGAAYVRFAAISDRYFVPRVTDTTLGIYPKAGGYRVVMPVPSEDDMNRLFEAIQTTPRTEEIPINVPDARVFVHRSRFWGFPDVTHVILTDDALILDSHLVYGKSDLGVNKARINGWVGVLAG